MSNTLTPAWRWMIQTVAILAVLYLLLVHWWFTAPMWAMAAERTALREQMQDMQQEVRRSAGVQARLDNTQPTALGAITADQNDSGALAAALGQKLDVWMLATPTTCQSVSRTPGAAQTGGRFSRTVVQVRLRCSTQGLVELMQLIEQESPSLLIENLEIASRRQMAAVDNQNTGLDVSLDVVLYYRAGRGTP